LRIVLIPRCWSSGADHSSTADALTIFLAGLGDGRLDGHRPVPRPGHQARQIALDLVADKLLVTKALLPCARTSSGFMAALLIGREFLVSGLRSVASAEGVVIPAGQVGKWKMGMSITAISFLIVTPRDPANTWPPWVPDGPLPARHHFSLGDARTFSGSAVCTWEYRYFIRPTRSPCRFMEISPPGSVSQETNAGVQMSRALG
jgi:hypothetical protein